ncbi:hypothetical protein Scep_002453 [Stephania cephalantha]|uniref:Uncharacterized protein n=1 Tax=Stephania cephalantha TaxID=152367 RepID=A0AAP0L9Y4_9MAGN
MRPDSQCTLQVQLLHVVCTPGFIFILFFEENYLISKNCDKMLMTRKNSCQNIFSFTFYLNLLADLFDYCSTSSFSSLSGLG